MAEPKSSIARLQINNDRFEILVKPDPALDFRNGKKPDLSGVLISDEIYSDVNKGTRISSDKLEKYFKTTDTVQIAKQILLKGELSLTTDQRRRMVEEKKRQIIQYINKNYVDPKTHLPHPILRIESAINQIRVIIDPFKRAEDQAKDVIDGMRKILPLKSEMSRLDITIPTAFSSQAYSVLKSTGDLKSEQWLSDGSLKVSIEINAGMKGSFLDRIGSITKGTAQVSEP